MSLKSLVERGFEIIGVVTKPVTETDKQPIAEWASSRGLRVLQPQSPKEEMFIEQVKGLEPGLIVVSAYHRAIPNSILDIPSWGTINVHDSLLPKYRGPNPHKWAIVNGEAVTGVSVHVMTPRFDDGDILAQKVVAIDDDDTGGSLLEKLSLSGAELLVESIEGILSNEVARKPQDETLATYFGYPTDQDRCIEWSKDCRSTYNQVRGLSPRPGAWTRFHGQKLYVWKAVISHQESNGLPGTIVDCSKSQLIVRTSTNDLIITEVTKHPEMTSRTELESLKAELHLDKGNHLE